MTDDQQAGTLAFLQNFYTGVTLYMPLEAEERSLAATPAPALTALAPAPSAVVAPVAPVATPPTAAPPIAAAPAVTPPIAAPAPLPVSAAPGRLPSLAALPPAPAVSQPAASVSVAAPVRPAAPPAAPPVPEAPYLRTAFNTLGSNAQGIVILVRLPETQFQKLPRNVFLNKLLQALQLVMADVVLVNVDGPYPVMLENLRREIAATRVLAFGKNLLDVAVRTTQIYEPVLFPNLDLAYLAAAEVEMVEYDVSLKKRLWSGLKAMFLN